MLFLVAKGNGLADTAPGDTHNQHHQRDTAEHVLGGGFKPLAQGAGGADLRLFAGELRAADPEEHDAGHQCAQGAQVDGAEVHPALL